MSQIHHSDFLSLPIGHTLIHHYTPLELPMAWNLLPISEVLMPPYWQNENGLISSGICNSFSSFNLSVWKDNVGKALREYPSAVGGEIPQRSNVK